MSSYSLVYLTGKKRREKVPLMEGGVLTIGRSSTADVTINDHKVSRIHCQIEVSGDKCILSDLNSTNGTFVNGKRVTEWELHHDDQLCVGITTFILKQDPEPKRPEGADEVRFCSFCKGSVPQKHISAAKALWLGRRLFCKECIKKGLLRRVVNAHLEKEKRRKEKAATDKYIGRTIGGYKIESKIGEGLIGSVYLAEQTAMFRKVALKILSPAATSDGVWLNKFLRQAHVAGQLVHPNILLVYDIGSAEGIYYISMEHVDGMDIRNVLRKEKALPVRRAMAVVSQVAQALDHAFEHEIVHGDIRPRNILMDRNRVVKLCGFGTSALLMKTPPSSIPKEKIPLSEYAYQPPEYFEEPGLPEFTSDIYSLGATLYHMLAGRPPFEGKTMADLERSIRAGRYKRLSEVTSGFPKPLCDIVDKAMARKPEDRFKVPKEVVGALEDAAKKMS